MSNKNSFWSTIPGILTGVSAVIAAITGLVIALSQSGSLIDSQEEGAGKTETHSENQEETMIPGYFFKVSQYARFTGTEMDPGYPKSLPGGWKGLPESWYSGIDAAVYLESNTKTYFFKGSQYARFTGTEMDPGYPKSLPGGWKGLPESWYSGIDAAVYLESNTKTYFFKGSQYARFTGTEMDPGYPKSLPGGWKGLPESWYSGIGAATVRIQPNM